MRPSAYYIIGLCPSLLGAIATRILPEAIREDSAIDPEKAYEKPLEIIIEIEDTNGAAMERAHKALEHMNSRIARVKESPSPYSSTPSCREQRRREQFGYKKPLPKNNNIRKNTHRRKTP